MSPSDHAFQSGNIPAIDTDVVTGLNKLAEFYFNHDAYVQAERLYQLVLTMREKAFGPEHADVADSLANLAALYDAQGNYAQAEPLYRRALAIWEAIPEVGYPDALIAMENYVDLLRKTKREREAIELEIRAHFIRVTYVQEPTPESERPKN
jgi:tetratricopeptide (TPR) repeat protein